MFDYFIWLINRRSNRARLYRICHDGTMRAMGRPVVRQARARQRAARYTRQMQECVYTVGMRVELLSDQEYQARLLQMSTTSH